MADFLERLCDVWGFLKDIPLSVVGFFGVIAAVVGIAVSRKTARQQATLEFMNEYSDSSKVSEGIRLIREIQDDQPATDDVLRAIDNPVGQENNEKRAHALFVLNKFEILAVGLKQKIYDRKMVEDFWGHDIKKFFELSEPIISHIRKEDAKAFVEFEELARRVKSGDKSAG